MLFYMFLSVLIMNLYKYKYIILVIIIIFFYLYFKYESKIIEGFRFFWQPRKKSREELAAEKARQQKRRDEYAAKKINSLVWQVSKDRANAVEKGAIDKITSSVREYCASRVSSFSWAIAKSGCK